MVCGVPVRRAMEVDGFAGPVTALAIDPTCVYLAVADRDDVSLCDPASAAGRLLDLPVRNVAALAFAPDGGLLAVAGGARVCLVETWAGNVVEVLDGAGPVDCLAFGRDGRTLAASVPNEAVHVYDLADRIVRWELEFRSGRIGALAFTDDARLIAAVAGRSTLELHAWPV